MRHFLTRWLISTLAVFLVAQLHIGIWYGDWTSLIGAALLLGIINATLRPVLMMLSLPLILFSLGFFILVVNALMLRLVGGLVPGFHVDSFGSAFFGSILIGIASWLISAFFPGNEVRVRVTTHMTTHGPQGDPEIKQVRGRVVE